MKENKVDRIYEAVRKINTVYEGWASKHGLTLYELQIYYEMLKKEEYSVIQKDLCQKLDAPKTSINSIIKKQIKAGRIQMDVNPLNKREKILSFTEEGKQFAETVIEPLLAYEEEISEQLDTEEIETAVKVQMQLAELLLEKMEKER